MKFQTLINFYVVLTLAFNSLVLFWFVNIILFGSVGYYEPRVWVLIPEVLLSFFMFVVGFILAYIILFTKKELILK